MTKTKLSLFFESYRKYFNMILITFCLYFFANFHSISHSQEILQKGNTGKDLFIKNRCVNCHTIGRGTFVGPDLLGVDKRYDRGEIIKWMRNSQEIYQSSGKMPVNEGFPPMPPMGVSTQDSEKIADYIKNIKVITNEGIQGGEIKGNVINKSSGTAVKEQVVTLKSYLGDRVTDENKTTTNNLGHFEFMELPWNRGYTVSLQYKGAEYETDKMVFYPNEYSKTLGLPLYEPIQDDSNIGVAESHMIIQADNNNISVVELMIFENGTDKAYIGKGESEDGKRSTLRFNLPEKYNSINFIHGLSKNDVIFNDSGFSDTSVFWPGTKRIVYTYMIPYESGKNTIENRINYPTGSFLLLLSDTGRKVDVKGLGEGDVVLIKNQSYLQWKGNDLRPGNVIKISIFKPYTNEHILKWGALGLIFVLIISGTIYAYVYKGKKNIIDINEVQKFDLDEERKKLIREIAELDDSFEANKIDEEIYLKIREGKKRLLIDLTKSMEHS